MVCPLGYVQWAGDSSMCHKVWYQYTTSPSYMYCSNSGDINGGRTFDNNNKHTCQRDIAVFTKDGNTATQSVLMSRITNHNPIIPLDTLKKLSKDWTEPLTLVARDGDRDTVLMIEKAKLTFPYEKEVSKVRKFWKYSCKEPAVPTNFFKYRSDVVNYKTTQSAGLSSYCKIDKYLNCED
jgi:hypothetical protein